MLLNLFKDDLGVLTGLSFGVRLSKGMCHRQGVELESEIRLSVVQTLGNNNYNKVLSLLIEAYRASLKCFYLCDPRLI